MRIPNPFKRKKVLHKRNPAKKLIAGFLFVPICFVLSIIIAFFWFDDFTMLFFMSGGVSHGTNGSGQSWGIPNDWNSPFPTEDWEGDFPSSQLSGASGAMAMYINSMNAGYYKEYLQIIKGHCDWSLMQDSLEPLPYKNDVAYPPISLYLGLQLSEGGLEPAGESASGQRIGTYSTMQGKAWKQDGKHTLSAYNSAVVREENGANLPALYDMDMCFNNHQGYITHFQMKKSYVALAPSGRLNASGTQIPSKMNGYGIAEGTVRSAEQSDAAYYPDLIAYAIQMSWNALDNIGKSTFNQSDANPTALGSAAYLSYAYGWWGWESEYAFGYTLNNKYSTKNWNSNNTHRYSDVVAKSLNWADSNIEKVLQALVADYEGYVGGLWNVLAPGSNDGSINHEDYMGMFVFTTLYHGGFIVPEDESRIRNAGDSFYRGATIAYRALAKNKNLTLADTRSWIANNMVVKDISSTYPGYVHKSDKTPYVYTIDTSIKVVPDAGGSPVPALHAYSGQSRGLYMWRIGGVVEYHRMLNACGVECTFEDAWLDANGKKFVGNSGPTGSYYWGTEPLGNYKTDAKGVPLANLTGITSNIYWRTLTGTTQGSSVGVHQGEDFGEPVGTPFVAMAPGKVTYAGSRGAAGLRVEVQILTDADSADNVPKMEYHYQHCSGFAVKAGDIVQKGDVIAYCGLTGNIKGAHNHVNVIVYRDFNNQKYYCPYKAIYEGKCTLRNTPACRTTGKDSDGPVYGLDTSKLLGTLKQTKPEDDKMSSKTHYYEKGLLRFLNEALAQDTSRR